MPKLKDLEGQLFGFLKVIKMAFKKGKHIYWECVCLCGNIKYNSTTNLVGKKVVSCGCYRKEVSRKSLSSVLRHTLILGEGSCNYLYNRYRQDAKKRKIFFDLDRKTFRDITSKRCHYCGSLPTRFVRGKRNNGGYFYNGIDRKNPKEGYTLKNIVAACKACNYAKNNIPYDEFILWLNNLIEYRTALKGIYLED